MAEITYQGATIYFEVTGDGDKIPLVLLHGFLEDSRIWAPVVKELQKVRQIICIDLPGHGRSQGIAEMHTMDIMAEVVHAVLGYLEVGEYSIAGHSMGGYVSLELLKKFPMLIKSLVLINSTPMEDTLERKKIRDRSVKLVRKNKDAYVSMAITNLYSDTSKERLKNEIEILKERAKVMKAMDISAAIKGMKIRTSYLEVLQSFCGQKVIIAGKEDPILGYRELEKVASACGCEFHLLENGHNSYMESTEELVKIMHFIE